uniref:Uncharacterized protein n=2 Tax=Quercus lobata TaxID=97700 RepID=A0A7N2KVP4_QUELO
MGNCSPKGVTLVCQNSIRILMDSGAVLEFNGPIKAREILDDHPGYGIFQQGQASSSLQDLECLISGRLYYLLPLSKEHKLCKKGVTEQVKNIGIIEQLEAEWMSVVEPAKMSSHVASNFVDNLANGSTLEVLPMVRDRVWRVKLVMDTKQLEEILKLRNKLKFNGDGSTVANDTTPAIGVNNLVARDTLLIIYAGNSMVRDTSPATSDQKRDPATSVGVLLLSQVTYYFTTTMAYHHHHDRHLHLNKDEEKPVDHKKEEKHHKHREHLGQLGAVAAGAYALHEKKKAKKDPEHAHKHKIKEEIAAAVAVGAGGYAFHEHHKKKEAKKEKKAHGKKHHHLF